MRTRTKILLTALVATLALAAVVTNATARRLEVSNRLILILFAELTFEEGGTSNQVICPVNLEGSFHSRTISKVSGQLIGLITEARIQSHPCRRNEAWILNGVEVLPRGETTTNTLPWRILYVRFIGPLPRITGIEIKLIGAKFRVEILRALSCLYRSTETAAAFGIAELNEAGQVTGLRANETAGIMKEAGQSMLCPTRGFLRGTARVGEQERYGLIFVRLVA